MHALWCAGSPVSLVFEEVFFGGEEVFFGGSAFLHVLFLHFFTLIKQLIHLMLLQKVLVSFPIEVFETEFFSPYHRMDTPPTKRSRREPCFCSLCQCAERCYSTVLAHRTLLKSAANNDLSADVASSSISTSFSATGVGDTLTPHP